LRDARVLGCCWVLALLDRSLGYELRLQSRRGFAAVCQIDVDVRRGQGYPATAGVRSLQTVRCPLILRWAAWRTLWGSRALSPFHNPFEPTRYAVLILPTVSQNLWTQCDSRPKTLLSKSSMETATGAFPEPSMPSFSTIVPIPDPTSASLPLMRKDTLRWSHAC